MVKQTRHYQILKYVLCDIIDGPCTEVQDITAKLAPDCKTCREYTLWKKSKLTTSEYLKKVHEEYLDETAPGWRDSK